MIQGIRKDNDTPIELKGDDGGPLVDTLSGNVLTGGTATLVDVEDAAGGIVPGVVFPIPLLESATPGIYQGIIPHTLQVSVGADYFVNVSFVSAAGTVANHRTPARGIWRE